MDVLVMFVCLLLPLNCLSVSLSHEYDHSAVLDPDEKFQVHWKLDKLSKKIHFALQVNTTGWVGFGIAKGLAGKMEDADIVIGYVVNSKGYLTDRHGIGNILPKEDDEQNYKLDNSMEMNGQTILKFHRDLETCDSEDMPIKEGTSKLIYSYNDVDPVPSNFETSILRHTHRGAKSMNLRAYIKNTPLPANISYIDIIDHQVEVPSEETTYWCSAHKLPDIGGKKHIIEIAPIIQPGHESLVHHILLYQCKYNFNDSYSNSSEICYTRNMPPPLSECAGVSTMFAWAIGSKMFNRNGKYFGAVVNNEKNFKMPENVGLPIGGPESSKYYVMEVHYDNPSKRTDYVDSSGLRFYYTDVRMHDAGLFDTGSVVDRSLMIPPGRNEWKSSGYCTKECSAKLDSPSGNKIHIFASMPHAHLLGRKIHTSLFRDGKEIVQITKDESYDFNFQQVLLLEEEVEMRAGDALVTSCFYDSSSKRSAILGGLGTSEEMCLNFFMYYPLKNLTSCRSEDLNVKSWFQPRYGRNGDWATIEWNSTMLDEYIESFSFPETLTYCHAAEGRVHMDVFYRTVTKPRMEKFLPVQNICDAGSNSQNIQSSKVHVFVMLVLFTALVLMRQN